MVENGYRLEQPEHCPDQVYRVIRKCWSQNSEFRPTFNFLANFFNDTKDNDWGGGGSGMSVTVTPSTSFSISEEARNNNIERDNSPRLPTTSFPRRNSDEVGKATSGMSLMSFD